MQLPILLCIVLALWLLICLNKNKNKKLLFFTSGNIKQKLAPMEKKYIFWVHYDQTDKQCTVAVTQHSERLYQFTKTLVISHFLILWHGKISARWVDINKQSDVDMMKQGNNN